MKPLKLVINAFGPYVDKTEIDFTKLGDNGLYLITGETGAGKTTIFDALSFALYGQASGSARSNSQSLRSDFAKDNNITYVDLDFLNNGEKYSIHRECAYKKINKNGNINNVSEKAEFIKPNGMTISTLSEVNEEINNILGIDKNQFAQIVMIAQGEFQRFLLASTKDKEKIFRKIFKTYFYQNFQMKLSEMYKDKVGEKENISLLLNKDVANIITNNEELENMIKDENIIYHLEDLIEALELCVKADEKENEGFDKNSKILQEQNENLLKEIEKAKTINQYIKDLAEINNKLPELVAKEKEAADIYTAEKNKENERNQLNTNILNLESSLKEYSELEEKQQELKNKTNELTMADNSLQDYQKKLEKLETEYTNNKTEVDKLKNISGEIEKNKTNIEKNEDEKEKLDDIQEKISDYRSQKDSYQEQKEISENVLKEYKEKQKYAEKVYEQFIANQAGNLAKTLQEGQACPVCGSKDHPKPAELSEPAVSEEDIEVANNTRDKAQVASTNEAKKLTTLETTLNNIEKELLKCGKERFGLNVIEGLEEEVEKAIIANIAKTKELKTEKENLNEKQKRKQELEDSINSYDEQKKNIETSKESAEKNKSELQSAIASIEATIEEKQKNLKYKTKDEAQNAVNCEKAKLKELQDAFEKAEKAKNDATLNLSNEKARKSELEKQIPEDFNVDIEKLDEEYKEKQETLNQMRENNRGLFSRMENNKAMLTSVKELRKQFEDTSNEVDVLNNLSRTANGQLGGKQKISFENYVLGTYFDEIIYAANQRFKDMTAGQFELKKAEAKFGNAQTGLDLDVFDSYTGKARSVSSLSGGETFKAALALSLGLSDIVQQQSGGIQIETMFIDEGFGSLDQESLEQTMKTLYELSGNKTLIGIISHVETLRERIEKKIIVAKTQTGSHLELNFV